MRDDDELRAVGELPQERAEATDVRVVERRLDLVEEIERARPARGRARTGTRSPPSPSRRRRGATGARSSCLPARARPRSPALRLLLGLGQPQPSVATREERRGNLCEVPLHSVERLGEPPVDGLAQLVAQLAQLVERPFEVLRWVRSSESRPFSCAYSSFANGLTPPSCSRRRSRRSSLSASSSRAPSDGSAPAGIQTPLRLGALRLEPRELDVDTGDALRRLGVLAPQLDLAAAERSRLGRQLTGARGALLGARRASAPGGGRPPRCTAAMDATIVSAARTSVGSGKRGTGLSRLSQLAQPPPPGGVCAAPRARAAPPRRCRR